MRAGLPVAMVLPSFPFKSSNTVHKVIARHADMAEKLALESLKRFCESVREFYPPGVAMVIVSDGRVYNSQFEIEVEYVLSYQKEVDLSSPSSFFFVNSYYSFVLSYFVTYKIRKLNYCADVSIVGLGDFLPVTREEDKRDALLALFGQSMDRIDEILKVFQQCQKKTKNSFFVF